MIHNITQGTAEWHTLRRGRITSSKAKTILKGGQGMKTYARNLAIERITGKSTDTFQGNEHTERGHRLEDEARAWYEFDNGAVEIPGYIEYSELVGGSPDGMTEHEVIEIKCPSDKVMDEISADKEKAIGQYRDQLLMNAMITGKKQGTLIIYHPDNQIIYRIQLKPAYTKKLEAAIKKCEDETRQAEKEIREQLEKGEITESDLFEKDTLTNIDRYNVTPSVFEEYARIQQQIKDLTEEAKSLRPVLEQEMTEDNADKITSPFGTFYFVNRTKFIYSKQIKKLEAQLKEAKKEEEESGKARSQSLKSLNYRS